MTRDRNQFFHAIWTVLPQEGDTLCIQLLEFFKKGLENPRLFLPLSQTDPALRTSESITSLHPLCYEEMPSLVPSAPNNPNHSNTRVLRWYPSIECVVQGTSLIRSQFNHIADKTPTPSPRESLLDGQSYNNHVRHYLDVFFNSSSTFLQVLKTRRPQLRADMPFKRPWDRYCVGGVRLC